MAKRAMGEDVVQGSDMKAIRQTAGLTQAQLAEAIGMTATSIGLMERGEMPIERRTELAVRYAAQQERPFPERIRGRISDIEWTKEGGDYSAEIGGFATTITPMHGDRWAIYLTHGESGYSVPWPRWEHSLEAAKASALLHAQFGLLDLYDFKKP